MIAQVHREQRETLSIDVAGRRFIESIRSVIPAWESAKAECVATPWEPIEGRDALGAYAGYESTISRDGRPVLCQTLRDYGELKIFALKALRALDGLARTDSFCDPSVLAPSLGISGDLRTLAVTYGLGPADDPFGGYWPTATVGTSDRLPEQALSPLVLWDDQGALAVCPANGFLTGSLIAIPGGVARGIQGAIDRLPEGGVVETILVSGDDVSAALMGMGDVLLRRGGKTRPVSADRTITSSLGWWNAYGGYYTEPIHPLAAEELKRVVDDVSARNLPIGYLGLDLWYPYDQIGQGIEFTPDRSKYPKGISAIVAEASLPTVLHVSALAQPNAYGSDGSDGRVYRTIAEAVHREAGEVVWHDWMRTQQHLTPSLRSDPSIAEAWYRTMASSLAERGLDVLQCMQTMGMALASTEAQNVLSARTSVDYLFALPESIDTLTALGQEGFRREAVRPVDLVRQNLLMGTVLYALGLLPFHDLFLTRFHEGIGGATPKCDAVVRALSCGPIGIGDAPGMADREILDALISAEGRLLQPDRPPFPIPQTLGDPVEVYWTYHAAGTRKWLYVLLLNRTDEPQDVDLAPPVPGDYVVRDGLSGELVERIGGTLAAGGLAYYVCSPKIDGIAPLGFLTKFVPASGRGITALVVSDGMELELNHVAGPFGIHCESPIDVTADDVPLNVARDGSVHTVLLNANHRSLHIRRR